MRKERVPPNHQAPHHLRAQALSDWTALPLNALPIAGGGGGGWGTNIQSGTKPRTRSGTISPVQELSTLVQKLSTLVQELSGGARSGTTHLRSGTTGTSFRNYQEGLVQELPGTSFRNYPELRSETTGTSHESFAAKGGCKKHGSCN